MKNQLTPLFAVLTLTFAPLAMVQGQDSKKDPKEHAEHEHEHDETKKGPNGGLLVHAVEPHFEIAVLKDRKAKITFLDDDNKPLPPAGQVITATGGDRANPTRITFTKGEGAEAQSLISDRPLPEGSHVPLVLQIKTAADAKAVTERITLHIHD